MWTTWAVWQPFCNVEGMIYTLWAGIAFSVTLLGLSECSASLCSKTRYDYGNSCTSPLPPPPFFFLFLFQIQSAWDFFPMSKRCLVDFSFGGGGSEERGTEQEIMHWFHVLPLITSDTANQKLNEVSFFRPSRSWCTWIQSMQFWYKETRNWCQFWCPFVIVMFRMYCKTCHEQPLKWKTIF